VNDYDVSKKFTTSFSNKRKVQFFWFGVEDIKVEINNRGEREREAPIKRESGEEEETDGSTVGSSQSRVHFFLIIITEMQCRSFLLSPNHQIFLRALMMQC
jgi:hypothetical protein